MVVRDGGCGHAHPCVDCGVETWPFEHFMVSDQAWAEAGAPGGFLCVGCLEARLDRQLVPDDFPPLPMNDDDESDSVRLRVRKGSGRCVERLYGLAASAVLELGAEPAAAAAALGIDADLLAIWVGNARFNEEAARVESPVEEPDR